MIRKLSLAFSAILVGASLIMGSFAETSFGQQPSQYQQPQYQNQSQYGAPQPSYQQPPQNRQGYAQPGARQPAVRPMAPIRRPASNNRPAPPRAPFQLTPEQQKYVNRVLAAWEKYGDKVETFETRFTLRTYGSVFNNGKDPKPQVGILKYGKPDKGFFEVTGDQPEKWICDGLSLYEFNHTKKEVVQHVLPPEERGQSIKNGPLPFLFGSTAAELNQRYWVRALPSNSKDEIWLEAYPKFARDAADFHRARMIISAKDLHPKGIQLLLPNRKTIKSYAFQDVMINDHNPLNFFKGDPFKPSVPRGWTKVVQDLQSAQATDAPQRR